MFYEKAVLKFRNINTKTTVLNSHFNPFVPNVPFLEKGCIENEWADNIATIALKRDSNTGVFLLILPIFLRTPFLKNICEQLLLTIVKKTIRFSPLPHFAHRILPSRISEI